MREMPEEERRRSPRWKPIGAIIAVAWVAALGYMVLVADPPDFWFDDIAAVDAPGHALAGFISGVAAYLFLARRRHAFLLALGASLVFLIGLELAQDLFTSRGYEASDVLLSVGGALTGVTAGAVGRRIRAKD